MLVRPTLIRAARAHTPLIRFPDRRTPKEAPPDIAKHFDHFRSVLESGPHFNPDKIQTAPKIADDLHQLSPQFWNTPALNWSEEELEAVMVRTS